MTRAHADDDLAYIRASLGRDLDVMLVYNLLRTHTYLGPCIDAGLREQQLTAAQLNVLLVLRTAGDDGLLMGEVGERLVVTKSNVTGLIDRLERQGLVTRCEHQDRRATVVRLTDAARQLLDRALPGHARSLAELTGCLDLGEKKTLVRLLTKLRAELRRQRKGSS
jgi:MarR family transcriptional regulator, 2-MHQ and catechol-resistance regulon repressor